MKRAIKLFSLVLAASMLMTTLVACSDSGKNNLGSGQNMTSGQITNSEISEDGENQIDNTNSQGAQSGSENNSQGGSQTVIRPDKNPSGTSSKDTADNTASNNNTQNNTQNGGSNNNQNNNNNNNNTSSQAPSGTTEVTFEPINLEGMTEVQKALVVTAESYFLRGARGQYDDTRVWTTKYRDLWRWQSSFRHPEDYTLQNVGYSNCAGFALDVYWSALNMDTSRFSGGIFANATSEEKIIARYPSSSWTDADIEKYTKEYKEALQPGDLIVYRYADNTNGHIMVYVGDNKMIHCTGNSYAWADKTEKYEANGCFRCDSIDLLFTEGNRRYLFDKKYYAIVRPLVKFSGSVPEKSVSRMNEMRGVFAEKLSSHTISQTAGLGHEITFTFSIKNETNKSKTLTITDTVPANATYVSGAQNKSGDNLSWTVTLPAGKSTSVSYKVKVKNDSSLIGKFVSSQSFIEKVPVNCPKITIGNTLTSAEMQKIKSAADKLKTSSLRDISLADAIYKEAIGKNNISDITSNDVFEGVYQLFSTNAASWPPRFKKLKTSGSMLKMIAPTLYGGRTVLEPDSPTAAQKERAKLRTRMITADRLVVGDIILVSSGTDGSYNTTSYMFLGDSLLNLNDNTKMELEPRLSTVVAENHFVVIRPSLTL